MESRPNTRAPRVTLVLALCMALGATGFSLGLAGVLSWNEPFPEMGSLQFAASPDEAEAWRRVEAIYREAHAAALRQHRPAINALAGVDLISSGALLYGAILAWMRSRKGLAALRTGLVLSQAYAFLAALVHTRVQLGVLDGLRPALAPLLQEGGPVAAAARTMQEAQAGAVALAPAIPLLQLAFYWWAHRWSRRQAVREALAPLAS